MTSLNDITRQFWKIKNWDASVRIHLVVQEQKIFKFAYVWTCRNNICCYIFMEIRTFLSWRKWDPFWDHDNKSRHVEILFYSLYSYSHLLNFTLLQSHISITSFSSIPKLYKWMKKHKALHTDNREQRMYSAKFGLLAIGCFQMETSSSQMSKPFFVSENKLFLSSWRRSNKNVRRDFFTTCFLVTDWKG